MTNRSKDEIIIELKNLISKKGYIYTLCMILHEDLRHDLNKIHQVNYRIRLSVKELSLILGFLVQNEINFSIPDSPINVIDMKNATYQLMEELHFSLNSSHSPKNHESTEKEHDKHKFKATFTKNGGMVEPMFYAGDGVYDFQYLEYLNKKYKYDKEWLLNNRKFDINEVSTIVQQIKSIIQEKSKKVIHLDLKDRFPEEAIKIRKKLRKHHTDEYIQETISQNYNSASFYQYKKLFLSRFEWLEEVREDWTYFYENLIDLFVIKEKDFNHSNGLKDFLNNFSFSPILNSNKDYNGPGYFNILNSKPIIKIDSDRYFVPINFLVAEAVYETPFYWMSDDKSYLGKLSKHRGDVGEEIAYSYLSQVFGKNNTYKSVLVTTKKGQPDTDIDVLCILDNIALCVQVKSKKLTLHAKRGDFEQLSKDFKGSVQDAYHQGLVSRSKILTQGTKFKDEHGEELLLSDNITEVYILSITTENHPSLLHQVNILLSKLENDPLPLALSVFDLELLIHYLPDPYDFLYYVRQRINLMDYYHADEELAFLGYHLSQKLWKDDRFGSCIIDSVFAGHIDRNYYPYKTGLTHLLSEKDDPILNRWKDPKFDYLAKTIKNSGHPQTVDIIFNLLDMSSESRKNIIDHIIQSKNKAKEEYKDKSIATSTGTEFGISYQVLKNTNLIELEDKVSFYSILKKYQLKCDSWLGLGCFASSPNLVDFLIYFDEPWVADIELQNACNDFFENIQPKIIKMSGNISPGRNDLCPCKSGLKFKRCCG